MSTQNNRAADPTRPYQRAPKRISFLEVGIVLSGIVAVIGLGIYGAYHWGWGAERTALTDVFGIVGVILVWTGVRHVLVNGGMLAPLLIGPDGDTTKKPAGITYEGETHHRM